ncbi:MAG: protein kinase [Myxococcales bacterium]|nr:protein kinase [Myxococcota bacterium]MDW8283627.1 protein kinase [Myxococcales bacterium]
MVDLHLLPANESIREIVLALGAISHPNLSRLRDAGVADGEIYIVEDHIEGVALSELLQHGPLPGDVTLHVAAALASALAEVEQLGLGQPALVLRVPRASEIFVSVVGQIKMALTALVSLAGLADALVGAKQSAAAGGQIAGRVVSPHSMALYGAAAAIGALVEHLLGPWRADEDPATIAARELAEVAQQGRGGPGDCRALHALAVQALRQTLTRPSGGFVFRKLSDLVERLAPRLGADEAEVAARGALLLAALPEGTPHARHVTSWYHGFQGGELPSAPGRERTLPRGGSKAGPLVLGQQLRGTPYKLLRKLGVGGMGIVFEAEHVDLGRRVALKLLHGQSSRDPQALARFRQEARSAARIKHPHIVEIYDFGTTASGEVFLVMELLEGQSLNRLCRSTPLSIERIVAILCQVCEAVEAAHQAGVIHRDLKPDNVMIVPARRPTDGPWPDLVKVLDFGIAKLHEPGPPGDNGSGPAITRQGQLFGTPEYMAPEQILGTVTDHRVDIYALGCIAYEMLTGELPFKRDSYGDMLAAHLKELPVPPHLRAPERNIPLPLSEAVLKAIAKEPARRYGSMAEFAEALRAALRAPQESGLSGMPRVVAAPAVAVSEPPVEPSLQAEERPSWQRFVLWGAIGAVLGAFGLVLWIAHQSDSAHRPSGHALLSAKDQSTSGLPPSSLPPRADVGSGPLLPLAPSEPPTLAMDKAVPPVPLRPPLPLSPAAKTPAGPAIPPPPPPMPVQAEGPPAQSVVPEPSMPAPPPVTAEPKRAPEDMTPAALPVEPEPSPEPPPSMPAQPPVGESRPSPDLSPPPPPRYVGGRLHMSILSISSAYGRRDVSQGLESQRRALDTCYQEAVQRSPLSPPRGMGTFTFAINEDGLVMAGRSSANGAVVPLHGCIEQALLRVRFPRPEIGPVLITIQFDLQPHL